MAVPELPDPQPQAEEERPEGQGNEPIEGHDHAFGKALIDRPGNVVDAHLR